MTPFVFPFVFRWVKYFLCGLLVTSCVTKNELFQYYSYCENPYQNCDGVTTCGSHLLYKDIVKNKGKCTYFKISSNDEVDIADYTIDVKKPLNKINPTIKEIKQGEFGWYGGVTTYGKYTIHIGSYERRLQDSFKDVAFDKRLFGFDARIATYYDESLPHLKERIKKKFYSVKFYLLAQGKDSHITGFTESPVNPVNINMLSPTFVWEVTSKVNELMYIEYNIPHREIQNFEYINSSYVNDAKSLIVNINNTGVSHGNTQH